MKIAMYTFWNEKTDGLKEVQKKTSMSKWKNLPYTGKGVYTTIYHPSIILSFHFCKVSLKYSIVHM